MTKIFDNAADFAATALQGFCDIFSQYAVPVRGGVLRPVRPESGKVSLVVGGGSGHYPAFAGYVGAGMADAAVAGDVFASPSTAAITRICRLAHQGKGILLGFGNYAGDVLNFGAAAERLKAEGIDVRVLPVTDDVASASREEAAKRRGVAGDLAVFKIAGAAAVAGLSIDDVERIARKANSVTVSFGVAFSGCTLPGSASPLFTVPEGSMALGLGIHGEPGTSEESLVPAQTLAGRLVEPLLAERPKNVHRVTAILNGLGSTKYEELFALWAHISRSLRFAGLEVVEPVVGEFVTSLDMQGCSLTLVYLDDELEELWRAPCDAPVLHRGQVRESDTIRCVFEDRDVEVPIGPASKQSRKDAASIAALLRSVATMLQENEEKLGRIDAQAGDGDHGAGMARGSEAAARAAAAALENGAGAATTLGRAADAWADRAGGTSGAIWGVLLRAWAGSLNDADGADGSIIVAGARHALAEVRRLGGANRGDKTLVDALIPFVETLHSEFTKGHSVKESWRTAADAATEAAVATADLTPKLGRARPLAHKSIGHPDAGAISLALCASAVISHLRC
ncbi:dihydroxyacetone kinase family protein [Rhizobium leucaenae]|uniref:dihydroxyacetone kinase family protein n=1 Tax=Rhizobium leucaenae TaxID=29450 RepID=UPI0007EE334F|nr:dihydroxyacetone kinase family protein [Rhizobium leucaenae]MBB6305202.1 dihydroxyacetone kinase [Rhizobium leucaenae]